MTAPAEQLKDWRGTPIEVGQTVIYGAPVGRSIALVQAIVDGFTDSGRVWLIVTHRAYGGYGSNVKQRVHVGPDRLTIVESLPPTDLPLESDKAREHAEILLTNHRRAIEKLHSGGHAHPSWARSSYGKPDLDQADADAHALKYHLAEVAKLEKALA